MLRITGSEVVNLMEAYSAVYAPQELTEEQIWEEVESWVNSLLEEGYDLSEYTWEEMYESYIEEQGGGRSSGASPGSLGYKPKPMGTETGRQLNQVFGQGNRLLGSAPRNTPAPGTRQNVRGGGSRPDPRAAARPASPAPSARPASPAPSARPAARPAAATPAARPAARPAAATPAARPAAATPAARPAADAKTAPTSAPATTASPARPSLSSQADEIRKMRAGSLARQGKTLDAATVSGTSRTAYQANSFDPFDTIKGHLLDERYADTEEAALKIMANMSEEWKQSIIEQLNPDLPGNTHSLADLYKAQEKWQRDQEKKKKEPKSGGSGASSQVKGV
jgi:hypothetical protein